MIGLPIFKVNIRGAVKKKKSGYNPNFGDLEDLDDPGEDCWTQEKENMSGDLGRYPPSPFPPSHPNS